MQLINVQKLYQNSDKPGFDITKAFIDFNYW